MNKTIDAPQPKKPLGAERRKYIPLDVKSWSEGFGVVIGWVLVIFLSIITGGLLSLYELEIINKGDRDLRDMVYDNQITTYATNHYHKHFINAQQCCNYDPVFFNATWCNPGAVLQDDFYDKTPPFCPPVVELQCSNQYTNPTCNLTRAAVYQAIGLTPYGDYANCTTNSVAGKVLVGAVNNAAVSRAGYVVAYYFNQEGDRTTWDELRVVSGASVINQTFLQEWIGKLVSQHGVPDYTSPNSRLTDSVSVDGQPADLVFRRFEDSRGGFRSISPWPKEIFTFPGMGARCPNTTIASQYGVEGEVVVNISNFSFDRPQDMVSTLTYLNDTLQFAQWKVAAVPLGDEVDISKLNQVTVSQIKSLEFSVGMVAPLGPCYGWMIDPTPQYIKPVYNSPVYTGPISGLSSVNLTGGEVTIGLTMRDVSAPTAVATPPYGGMWYIVFTFGMAAIWIWATGLFIVFALPLIWWNVRSNKGKPPVIYRYMKKYRGW